MALTLVQVRTAVDDRLATLWATIQTRQNTYFAQRSRFWQGIRYATPPVDGAECTPVLTVKPTDQNTDWADTNLSLNATEPMALEIHTYQSPIGHGYQAVVTVTYGGKTYQRSQATGPEQAARTFAWRELTEVAP